MRLVYQDGRYFSTPMNCVDKNLQPPARHPPQKKEKPAQRGA
jgi:hypothetical protein